MISVKNIFCIISLLFFGQINTAQETKELFRSDEILDITISMPVKKVINDTKERNKEAAKLSYTMDDGMVFEHQINVSVRGKTRTLKQICNFPPLELNFNKSDTKNSVFKGQKKLKLVTHCQFDNSYEEYVQKEYIVYKMYQNVSPFSFKVRPCRITYIDSDKPKQQRSHFGFLIERIKDVAKRNDMKVFKDSIRNQSILNKDNLDKLMLFEYLIGNLDWSIPKEHNMKLIQGEKGSLPLAVPYDFDYSGIVDIPYAVPPGKSNVEDVKTRVFRGFCRADGYKGTVEFYKSIREDLYSEIDDVSFLTDQTKNSMTRYMNSFYKILDDPKQVEKKISRACRVNHKHAYE
jgi:hypothetical protein